MKEVSLFKKTNIIQVSCGIGKSFEEATNALLKAKKNKGKVYYNIQIYKGKILRSKIPEGFKVRAKNFLRLAKKLSQEERKILEEVSLRDPITGMYNKTGFVIKLEALRKEKRDLGYYMLFDLDDLHYWNHKIGYSKVDKYIEVIGKVIAGNVRHNRGEDIVAHRLNESAGDEFLVFTPSKFGEEASEKIKLVAKRLINKIYGVQKNIKII